LLYPNIDEISTTINRVLAPDSEDEVSFSHLPVHPMKIIKKNTAEMNKEKGSNNLVLMPVRSQTKDKQAMTSLVSLDYIPIYSKS